MSLVGTFRACHDFPVESAFGSKAEVRALSLPRAAFGAKRSYGGRPTSSQFDSEWRARLPPLRITARAERCFVSDGCVRGPPARSMVRQTGKALWSWLLQFDSQGAGESSLHKSGDQPGAIPVQLWTIQLELAAALYVRKAWTVLIDGILSP
jgi:hypothetical protein